MDVWSKVSTITLYTKTREDANLQKHLFLKGLFWISTFYHVNWDTSFDNLYVNQRKKSLKTKSNLYVIQFSNKKGPLENLQDQKAIWAAHRHTHLSTLLGVGLLKLVGCWKLRSQDPYIYKVFASRGNARHYRGESFRTCNWD